MIDNYAHFGEAVSLGYVGENQARRIVFDITAWNSEYPGATITLLNVFPGTKDAYPVSNVTVDGDNVYWIIESADVPKHGCGCCELIATLDDVIVKSVIYKTMIMRALDDSGEVPEPWESWQELFARNAAEARDAANDAEAARDEIAGITAEAVTLAPGSAATAAYDAGHLVIGVPQGLRGETGAQGPKGETYTLTAQDRRDIVEAVLEEYPAAEGVMF